MITDLDNDGKNEIWMVDKDGDIFSYNILGPNNYSPGRIITTGFVGSSAYLTTGNYTGDSSKEIAVLLHSDPNLDIAPYHRLLIFNIKSDSVNIIYDNTFIDPANEFASQFQDVQNSIRFADIDNDGKDELILFASPYSYVFKYINGVNTIISYNENINSNSVFVGDLNRDGVPEVAFPSNSGINFYQFAQSVYPSVPFNLSGYSIDSSRVKISWDGTENKFYIYRGISDSNLVLVDSSASNTFVDNKLTNGMNYYYAVASVDYTKKYPVSKLSSSVTVYTHNTFSIVSVKQQSANSLMVTFSGRINTTIENLQAFELIQGIYPNSIASNSQYSYLVSFNNPFKAGLNKVTLHNLYDYYNSPFVTDTVQFNVDSTNTGDNFYAASFQIINPYRLALTFNLDVDSISASNTNNYVFSPDNKVTSVQLDKSNPKTIYLNLTGQKPIGSIGISYKLNLKNIYSSNGTGKIRINENGGSVIELSAFANDLSNVYVYPSPVRISAGESKITFANLPKKASIIIFSLAGKKINKIDVNTENGGVDYNLTDDKGNKLSSGVYIYRIARLDNSNNELEKKLGKFAVIR